MSAMEVISLQTGCKGAYGRVGVSAWPHGALARNGLGLDGVCVGSALRGAALAFGIDTLHLSPQGDCRQSPF